MYRLNIGGRAQSIEAARDSRDFHASPTISGSSMQWATQVTALRRLLWARGSLRREFSSALMSGPQPEQALSVFRKDGSHRNRFGTWAVESSVWQLRGRKLRKIKTVRQRGWLQLWLVSCLAAFWTHGGLCTQANPKPEREKRNVANWSVRSERVSDGHAG